MLRRLGYASQCLSLEDTTPRGARLSNATETRLRELIALNLNRLERVIHFNAEHGVRLFRISSDVVPFGSHPVNHLVWWDEFGERLAQIGTLARQHAVRLSMHPGQYTLLNSPDTRITRAAVADLVYHTRFLDALGVDCRNKVIIHVGGGYGDRPAALQRWIAEVIDLPHAIRRRLVVENDERLFGAEDVLAASHATGVPVIFDVLHHRIYAGEQAEPTLVDTLQRAAATWDAERDGVPKIHYSSQAAERRPGAHAEYVAPEEFADFLQRVPKTLDFDCMLEAKAKDLALFHLRDALGLAA
ncbi:MAG: UV DNA damage repair endonuclease UvsE [Chloroflexota bacterium]